MQGGAGRALSSVAVNVNPKTKLFEGPPITVTIQGMLDLEHPRSFCEVPVGGVS